MRQHQVPLHRFTKAERTDAVTQRHLTDFTRPEGMLYRGTAQEKFTTVRIEKRVNPATGQTYPWLVCASARAKVYNWCVVEEDFGPLFIKVGRYLPFPVKARLKGHAFLKRQLAEKGFACKALDNNRLSCADNALALTQVFVRPLNGRDFFEQIINDTRPDAFTRHEANPSRP